MSYYLNKIPYDYTVEVTNRFKGFGLIDKVPEELWTEVRDIVQEAVMKIIPKKKKCEKAKWLSEEALKIGEERREVKGKEERERYTQLSAEFRTLQDLCEFSTFPKLVATAEFSKFAVTLNEAL